MPRPISSRSTRLRAVAVCRIALVSLISTMNVDWPRTRLSLAPTRVKMRSTIPMRAALAGTKLPICAISTIRPICRKTVDLPAMFGPVRMIMRASRGSRRSFGMNLSRGIMRSTTGWRPAAMSSSKSSRHRRTDVSLARRDIGERAQHIELGDRARDALQPRDLADPPSARSASNSSRSRVSIRSAAVSTCSSYSLSAGVTKRSPDVIVCRR